MRLFKSDLKNIGHTIYNENGLMTVVCSMSTVNIEEILLREILKEFGNYQITCSKERVCECSSEIDYVFYTNLPMIIYNGLDQ